MRIPPGINQKVIEDWLNGLSRDEIAQRNRLSAGTISNIIKQTSVEIGERDIEVIRSVAKLLKNEEIKLDGIIQCVRIKKRIQAMGLDIEPAERYIELMDEHCFREQIEPEKFIESIDFVVNLPDEERNVKTLEEKLRLLRQDIKLEEEKLENLKDQVKKESKSIRESKKEKKELLSDLSSYKEIKEAVGLAERLDIHPDITLSWMIEKNYNEIFKKTDPANTG